MTTLTVNSKIERLNAFLKIYNILVFLNALYLFETLKYILTCLDFIENILILFCHSFYIH